MSISAQEFSGGKPLVQVSAEEFSGGQPLTPVNQPQGSYASQTLQNAPGSLGKFISGIGSAIAHPMDTLETLGRLGLGTAGKLLPGAPKAGSVMEYNEKLASSVGQDYKQAYGGLSNIKETFKNDPFRVLGDVAAIGSLGAGAVAKGAQLGGFTRLATAASKAASVAEVFDPLVAAGKLLKSTTNVAGRMGAAGQRATAPVLAGVSSEVVSGIQNADVNAAKFIASSMRNSAGTRELVESIGSTLQGLDHVVWKIARQEASKIKTLIPAGGIVDDAINRLGDVGISFINKVDKKGNVIGIRAFEGGRLTRSAVDSTIVPILEDFRRIKAFNRQLTTNQLWDKAQLVSNSLKKLEGMAGYEDVLHAIHGAVTDAMPAGFWEKVQAQNKVREISEAVKATFGNAAREGYSSVPGKAAQTTELRLGQLFGKGKTVARENVMKFEETVRQQAQMIQDLTGLTLDELVVNGTLTADMAAALKNPQLLNMALGHAVSGWAPNVLRALSAAGGSIGAAFGLGLNPIPAMTAGYALASPRFQGELANMFGNFRRAGGAGAYAAKSLPGRAVAGTEKVGNILRALTSGQQSSQ